MPCPFGFTADDDADGDSISPQEQSKQEKKEGDREDVSWFYKNQIKADKEAQARKRKKQEDTKRRLEAIMAAKNRTLEYEPDVDDASIASSELSELDSDVHSLSSLRSCAQSWIEDAGYKAPAEAWVKYMTPFALGASGFVLFHAHGLYQVANTADPTHTVNAEWPVACGSAALALAFCSVLQHYSAMKRSKRLLLLSQAAMLVIYTVSAALTAYAYAQPTMIDPVYMDTHCPPTHLKPAGRSEGKPPKCRHALTANKDLDDAFLWFFIACVAMSLAAVCLVALGVWYVFELAFIEKKAAKHMKRHRHHKHRIPWHKIKVVGPVMTCGQGGGGHGAKGGKSGGKCPVMH